jgi:hypothetical protein
MAELGGYFAVTYIAEHVFTDAIDAAWYFHWDEWAVGAARWAADTPFGRLEAAGAVSLAKPEFALRGATNTVGIRLIANCRFELMLDGTASGGVFIKADASVSVPVKVSQDEVFHKAVVDLSGITLESTQLRLTWFEGPTSSNSEAALLSRPARTALTDELRRRAANFLTFRIPTDKFWEMELSVMTKGNPGSIIFTPFIKLGAARILDGWFALGVDATSSIAETHGDPARIGPPPAPPPPGPAPMPQADPGDASLRVILDPNLVRTYLIENAKFALRLAAAIHPTFHPSENVGITLENDTVVVRATGAVDAPDPFPGTVPFTADVRVRPFIPKNTSTVYASVKPDVRADTPLFLEIIGAIADFFGADVFEKLRRANRSEMAILFGAKVVQKIPGSRYLTARIAARQLVMRPDLVGIYGEAFVGPRPPSPGGFEADLTPSVFPTFWIRHRFLRLRHRGVFFGIDPTYRIRYRIRRGSNGAEVTAGVTWSGSHEPFGRPVDLWDNANVLEKSFTVELAVERPPGTVLARHTQSVTILDLFDRSHPFVRWRKKHFFTGGGPITRLSAIHRTDIRKRCKFCDIGTLRNQFTYDIEPLDSLPAPEVEGFSSRLCKYCFPDH